VISHDRYFLDNVVDHILELEEGHGTLYTGNFTAYQEERRRRAQAAAARPGSSKRTASRKKQTPGGRA
jgi:ATPase subunit of ABC transporter with duplicated ATPase domains